MEQTNLFASYERIEPYMNTFIEQPKTKMKPWCVHLEGWRDTGIDVEIYHESLNDKGVKYFRDVKFRNARHFASFIAKMIDMYITAFSKPYIEIRAIDVLALIDGYEKGERDCERVYIETVRLD